MAWNIRKEVSKMKSTGIVRKIDGLGRIVIPMELRRTMGLEVKDPIEIFVDGNSIVLRMYRPGCEFCSNKDNLIKFEGRNVCASCIDKMSSKAKGESK